MSSVCVWILCYRYFRERCYIRLTNNFGFNNQLGHRYGSRFNGSFGQFYSVLNNYETITLY